MRAPAFALSADVARRQRAPWFGRSEHPQIAQKTLTSVHARARIRAGGGRRQLLPAAPQARGVTRFWRHRRPQTRAAAIPAKGGGPQFDGSQ